MDLRTQPGGLRAPLGARGSLFAAAALVSAAVMLTPQFASAVCELPSATPATARSRDCLVCHDGSVAPGTAVTLPGEILAHGEDRAHPIELDYLQAALRRPGTLTPAAALPKELVLSAGLLTCVTCHHPQSREKWRLAVPLAGSGLCFACHTV